MKTQPESDTSADSSRPAGKADVYDIVNGKILAMLDKGEIPWRKPWNFTGGDGLDLPRNFVSKKPYNGFNVFLLLCSGYDCPYWLSYKQAKELAPDGGVRKGEKGTPVVFWKRLPKVDRKTGAPVLNAKGKQEMVFFLRYYTVFNVLQCDGIKWEKPVAPAKPDGWTALTECESIVAGMPLAPVIKHAGGRACYSPTFDTVAMPARESFPSASGYYATLFHELAHSTGHKTRLARKGIDADDGDWMTFGSASYAREELVAEMGSAFLCGFAGIMQDTLENSVAYIQHWRKRLQEDNRLVVIAAAQAQKAADYIRAVKKEETAEE